MGLLDKVKAQAEQVAAKAQQGVAQGQAKMEASRSKAQHDALLRELGAAYYAEQREGGSHDAVAAALAALDAHGPVDAAADVPAQPSGDAASGGAASGGAASDGAAAADVPPGGYRLDDL